jgi:hypothetical protein
MYKGTKIKFSKTVTILQNNKKLNLNLIELIGRKFYLTRFK